MDSLKQLIKEAEAMISKFDGVKIDDKQLKSKKLEALKELDEAKRKLNKALKDADNIK